MVHEIFGAGTGALDDLEHQHQDAEREQDVAHRHRPLGARHQGQLHQRILEMHAGHQEGDDVVDRDRNQKQRKTDLLFERENQPFSGAPWIPQGIPQDTPPEPSYLIRWPNSGRHCELRQGSPAYSRTGRYAADPAPGP